MRADFPRKLSLLKRFQTVGCRLLDIGCGRGFFLSEARKEGYEVSGIDISEPAVRHAKDVLKLDVRQGTLEGEHDWCEAFDIVVMLATIEHLPDPGCTLQRVANVLRPSGLLLIDTGLAGDLCDTCGPGTTQWYEAPQHLWVFSRAGLETLLGRAGLSVAHVDTCFERSHARRFLKKGRNALASVLGSAFWFSLLGPTGWRQLRLEAKLPLGNLILIVATKGA